MATYEIAYLCIQCTAANDERVPPQRGVFLTYDLRGVPGKRGTFVACTPIYASCVDAFAALKADGWSEEPYDSDHPCGSYSRPIS